ncbi:DUF4440 domain-containing protein [Raoultella planticola]|uniref:DUF4440 domain-containing protein n=1 Tax=Raoultella planticola TaxID=575 RepID=UPI001033392A|nr:DUF4440 domain-containing protein [Raoultella planticola]
MNPYIQETIDAHVAIEHWLSHKQGAVEALMARFSPDFSMVGIGGNVMDHRALSAFFTTAGGSRPGLSIIIDSSTTLAEWHDGAVICYRERQRVPEQSETLRWSTVLFRKTGGRILWRHLHETRQA